MKKYGTEFLRNVALLGHGGAGKTSLAEAMLFVAKGINRLGRVDDGTSIMDFDPEETRRGITINTSLAPVEWKDNKINILDTPGYFDFVGDVIAAVTVADSRATGRLRFEWCRSGYREGLGSVGRGQSAPHDFHK